MTRLARGDATMGAGIAATNARRDRRAGCATLRAVIDEWLALLEAGAGPDEPVAARAARGRPRRGSWPATP